MRTLGSSSRDDDVEDRRSDSVIGSSRVLFCVRISSQSKTRRGKKSISRRALRRRLLLHPAACPHSACARVDPSRAVAFLAYESSPALLNPKRKYDKRTRKPTKRMTKRHVTTSRISCTGRRPRRRGRSAWSATVNLGGAYDTAGGRTRARKKITLISAPLRGEGRTREKTRRRRAVDARLEARKRDTSRGRSNLGRRTQNARAKGRDRIQRIHTSGFRLPQPGASSRGSDHS